jgi:hypothetical protein
MAAPTQSQRHDFEPGDRSRTSRRSLRSDLERLRSGIAAAVEAEPLAALATAATIGFVLGGGLTRPAIGLLIQTGSRLAANRLGDAMRSHAYDVPSTEENRS